MSSKKVYRVIRTDLRAIYIDVAADYSLAFRRFVSIHGYPKIMSSDRGSQLSCASQELKAIACDFNREGVESYGLNRGLTWWNGVVNR